MTVQGSEIYTKEVFSVEASFFQLFDKRSFIYSAKIYHVLYICQALNTRNSVVKK